MRTGLLLLGLMGAGCAHLEPEVAEESWSASTQRIETRVGSFEVRADPGEGEESHPARQLRQLLAGEGTPTVFYAGTD